MSAVSGFSAHAAPFYPPTVTVNTRPFQQVFHTSGIAAQLTRPIVVSTGGCDPGWPRPNDPTRAQINIIIDGLATEFSPELAAMGWRIESPPRRIASPPAALGPKDKDTDNDSTIPLLHSPRRPPLLTKPHASRSPAPEPPTDH